MGLQGGARTTIAAPAMLIWCMVSDITRMGEWSPENTGGQWIEPAHGPEVGARFIGHNKRRSSWTTTAEVLVAEAGAEFTFRVGKRRPTVWSYHLTPQQTGTDVQETFEVPGYGRIDQLMFRLTTGVADRQADLVSGCRLTLARLKDAAELAAESGTGQQ